MYERQIAGGFTPEEADARSFVGFTVDDPWIYMLRDAVEFPDGSRRTHTRVLNNVGDGAAVLPLYRGRIVLTKQYRHAVRRFVLEAPRGALEPGKTPEDVARMELMEEIGATATSLTYLGHLLGSANLYANGASLYLAQVSSIGAPQIHEAIMEVVQLTVPEFERALLAGEILDSFTVAAFTQARLRGLL
jgi:ADP-ribose pyrophosphatase